MRVQVRILDPHYYDRNGYLHIDADSLGWSEVPLSTNDVCEHSDTICFECLESWTYDYEVRFVHHGRDMTTDDLRGFDDR